MMKNEDVILLDASWQPCGTMPKNRVHTRHTPLHMAFSCYLFTPEGKVLVTRRALSKTAWPGVWTNSFCGHPLPQEALAQAVMRRAQVELATEAEQITLQSDAFSYQATDVSGIMENEVCPVFAAHSKGVLDPNPDEVADYAWVDLNHLMEAVKLTPFGFSPWMVLQLNTETIASGLKEYRDAIMSKHSAGDVA
ncbi:isopentenyl-diphosphate Delta-isomerase [Serratia marcescens]|uniref:isopentenyl-diphosphate Delta-isomerase n=1 Tax=Serratia marcescens TaxID=615 RepID=UPI0011E83627|nr:isopentenyl-diphosphate Delta-isomerase [Serratia marcescens]